MDWAQAFLVFVFKVYLRISSTMNSEAPCTLIRRRPRLWTEKNRIISLNMPCHYVLKVWLMRRSVRVGSGLENAMWNCSPVS